MNRLQNLPFYDFSMQNKYAQNYNIAYKRAVQAQNEIIQAENSPYSSVAEIEKWKSDLKRWESKAEDYSILAKKEENKLDDQIPSNTGKRIDFMA